MTLNTAPEGNRAFGSEEYGCVLTMKYDLIPNELKERRQWVCWRLVHREGKTTKLPFQPNGTPASTTDPQTWNSFEECCAAKGFDGIGFVFSADDPYCGIDLDHVRDSKTGQVEAWAFNFLLLARSYTELSQSGSGFHVIVCSKPPALGCRRSKIEVYGQGRFFVMTGNVRLFGTIREVDLTKFDVRAWADILCPAPTPTSTMSQSGKNSAGNSESEEDYRLIGKLRMRLPWKKAQDAGLVEREFARKYPQRYAERNKRKGRRGSATYIGYCIARQIKNDQRRVCSRNPQARAKRVRLREGNGNEVDRRTEATEKSSSTK